MDNSRFERGWFGAVAGPYGRSASPGGNSEDGMCEERGLRRGTQAERGEAMIAADETDGGAEGGSPRGAGACPSGGLMRT